MKMLYSVLILVSLVSSPALAVGGKTQADKIQKDIVTLNIINLKYHRVSCKWAKRCTTNCIDVARAEAIRRGGVPCKVCRGRK